MKCKVCQKELFIELDFRSLFKLDYKIHESCKKELEVDLKMEVIPIENNIIRMMYFYDKNIQINVDYVEFFLIGKGIEYCLNNRDWSTINWMTLEEYHILDVLTQYLFLKLNDQSIVFLKLFQNM